MENATAADSSQSNSRKNQEIVSFCSNEYQKQTLYPSKNLYRWNKKSKKIKLKMSKKQFKKQFLNGKCQLYN